MSSPCTDDHQLGPSRNCGFTQQTLNGSLLQNCIGANTTKTVVCTGGNADQPMIVRICEGSRALNAGVDCSFNGDGFLAQAIVASPVATNITFTCPAARDSTELGLRVSVYTAPLLEADGPEDGFSCTVL